MNMLLEEGYVSKNNIVDLDFFLDFKEFYTLGARFRNILDTRHILCHSH